MANKDKSYDPLPEYDSGDEHLSHNMDTDQEMNNNKVHSPPSHPGSLMGAFVYNNTSDSGEVCEGGGGWRRGGPLMDTGVPQAQAQAQAAGGEEKKDEEKPVKICINSDNVEKLKNKGEDIELCKTEKWYKAANFACAGWYANDETHLEAHNKLCEECARDDLRCPECPYHSGGYYERDDTPEPA